jgi:hypothetical protein
VTGMEKLELQPVGDQNIVENRISSVLDGSISLSFLKKKRV